MTETWKQWEGHILNGEFPLQRYLGGSDHSAVFLTERAGEPQRAVKFISVDLADRDSQLLRWKAAAVVTHPNLLRIFETGENRVALTGTRSGFEQQIRVLHAGVERIIVGGAKEIAEPEVAPTHAPLVVQRSLIGRDDASATSRMPIARRRAL